MTVTLFGANEDLTLDISKDCDYVVGTDIYNMVFISTKQNGEWVDDTGDVHVNDLYNELERIWKYQNFKTL